MNFALAAADSRLEVVVSLTQWLAQPHHPSVATRQSYLTDRVFDWMPGVDTVTINTGWFADNCMAVLGTIAQLGIFPFPLGAAKTAPVSNEDIARVVVGVLTNPAPRVGKFYRPTGPELLDPHQLAAVYAKVLERRVKYQSLSDRMFLKALSAMGMDAHMCPNCATTSESTDVAPSKLERRTTWCSKWEVPSRKVSRRSLVGTSRPSGRKPSRVAGPTWCWRLGRDYELQLATDSGNALPTPAADD